MRPDLTMHFLANYWYCFLTAMFFLDMVCILNLVRFFRTMWKGNGSLAGFGWTILNHTVFGFIGFAVTVIAVISVVARLMKM
jgi:hypothetical protein